LVTRHNNAPTVSTAKAKHGNHKHGNCPLLTVGGVGLSERGGRVTVSASPWAAAAIAYRQRMFRLMVRDAVVTVVSRLIVYAGELIASAARALPPRRNPQRDDLAWWQEHRHLMDQ
jgi:hypothetical protein